jgi:hypothetical protein
MGNPGADAAALADTLAAVVADRVAVVRFHQVTEAPRYRSCEVSCTRSTPTRAHARAVCARRARLSSSSPISRQRRAPQDAQP